MAIWVNVVLVGLLLWPGVQSATPITEKSQALRKVAQLLQELSSQLADDAKEDIKQFGEFEKLTKASIAAANATVLKSTAEVAELKAEIASADAFQAEKKGQLAEAADSVLKAQQDLQRAKQQRLAEKETFIKNSQRLQQSSDNLNLALTTVKSLFKDAPRETQESQGTGLVQAAKQIRTALNAGADELLTSKQQHFLANLLRAPARSWHRQAQISPGFLEVEQRKNKHSAEVEEDLEAPEGVGDLTVTLKQVKDQTETEMSATRQAEQKSAEAFRELTKSLEDEVTTRQTALTEIKSSIASSEEAAGKAKSSLISATRRLTVTDEQLVQLQADLKDKTKDFKMRKDSRGKEEGVIKKAIKILSQSKKPEAAASFLQLAQSSHDQARFLSSRKVARLMSKATSPGLAALLLETQSSGRKDVFQKVKAMIHDMLSKLQEQQAQDSRRDAWCKTEMAKTHESKASKTGRADKMKTKMLAINAELASLKSDIATAKEEIGVMKEALGAAKLQRQKEQRKAKSDLIMYEEDQRVLKEALVVLREVYDEAPVKGDKHGYKAKAQGSGVVSLLQVSMDNFAELEEEASTAEKKAAADFQEMESATQVRLATFQKDVEYNSQTYTKLESDLVRGNSDLKSYEKEVKALTSYLEELDASCSVKGLSFEERQQKRQQQLDSLKEALRSLKKSD